MFIIVSKFIVYKNSMFRFKFEKFRISYILTSIKEIKLYILFMIIYFLQCIE